METIENSIKCFECTSVLEKPVLLPCGESICYKHVKLNETVGFTCRKCAGILHATPVGGFLHNKALEAIINAKIHKIQLCDEYDDAYRACKSLNKSISEVSLFRNDPYYFINKIIGDLKRETDILREEHKLKIDERANQIIDELDKYEQECKRNLDSSDFSSKLTALNAHVNTLKQDVEKWQKLLGNFDSSRAEWKKVKEKSQTHLDDLEARMNKFKNDLLLRKLREYHCLLISFTKIDLLSNKK
jgi:chromosome segregation ATPase